MTIFRHIKKLTVLTLFSALALLLNASDYYCDPINGSMSNDGSLTYPWSSLSDVFGAKKSFAAGDTLFLMTGAHGECYISQNNTDYVSIKTYNGAQAFVSSIQIDNSAYWAFEDITFTNDGTGGNFTRNYLFSSKDNTTHLKFNNCKFYSGLNSNTWSKQDWYDKTCDALIIRGDYLTFTNNLITNIYHGLEVRGDYAYISNNTIDNFGADAIRALSSNSVYEDNLIRDAYIEDYNINHDDAIQMYDASNVAGGIIKNVNFSRNTIYNFADSITQHILDEGLVGYSMQGIIITDGHAENVLVDNNLIVSDHYHGITLVGADSCRIQNNTVIKTPTSLNPDTNTYPWIQYTASKSNIECSNSIMRNNIASKYTLWTHEDATNMTVEANLEPSSSEYVLYFIDYDNANFELSETSPALDAGLNFDLAELDLITNPRLVGNLVDCGAYEYQSNNACDSIWASSFQDDEWGYNPPKNAFDKDLESKWAANGVGEYIQIKYCERSVIDSIMIAFPWGHERVYDFIISVSEDNLIYTELLSTQSSGTTEGYEYYDVENTPFQYLKVTGNGNSTNTWNNISEVELITSDETTSLSQQHTLSFISLFPNPSSSGGITLVASEEDVQSTLKINVMSLYGKGIKQFTTNTTQTYIDLSILSAGLYLVELSNASGRIVKTLLIQ